MAKKPADNQLRKVLREKSTLTVAFHALLAWIVGDRSTGLFLSQVVFYHLDGYQEGDWFPHTREQWRQELHMERRKQESARDKLKAMNLLFEEVRGTPATLHFCLNEKLLTDMINSYKESSKQPKKLSGKKTLREHAIEHNLLDSPKTYQPVGTKVSTPVGTKFVPTGWYHGVPTGRYHGVPTIYKKVLRIYNNNKEAGNTSFDSIFSRIPINTAVDGNEDCRQETVAVNPLPDPPVVLPVAPKEPLTATVPDQAVHVAPTVPVEIPEEPRKDISDISWADLESGMSAAYARRYHVSSCGIKRRDPESLRDKLKEILNLDTIQPMPHKEILATYEYFMAKQDDWLLDPKRRHALFFFVRQFEEFHAERFANEEVKRVAAEKEAEKNNIINGVPKGYHLVPWGTPPKVGNGPAPWMVFPPGFNHNDDGTLYIPTAEEEAKEKADKEAREARGEPEEESPAWVREAFLKWMAVDDEKRARWEKEKEGKTQEEIWKLYWEKKNKEDSEEEAAIASGKKIRGWYFQGDPIT